MPSPVTDETGIMGDSHIARAGHFLLLADIGPEEGAEVLETTGGVLVHNWPSRYAE
jgi:hypothetical protein